MNIIWSERIEWFIENQAFSPLYDLTPPPPASPISKLEPRHTGRLRETTCGRERGGIEPNHTTARTNHVWIISILFGFVYVVTKKPRGFKMGIPEIYTFWQVFFQLNKTLCFSSESKDIWEATCPNSFKSITRPRSPSTLIIIIITYIFHRQTIDVSKQI